MKNIYNLKHGTNHYNQAKHLEDNLTTTISFKMVLLAILLLIYSP